MLAPRPLAFLALLLPLSLFPQQPLTLASAIREAIEKHPLLAAADGRVSTAQGLLEQAALKPNPRLTVQLENLRGGWQSPYRPLTDNDHFIYITQTLETARKRERRTDLATANKELAAIARDILAQRIAAQADVRALEEFHFPASTFLLALDAKPIGRAVEAGAPFSARYRIGEEFSLSASLEQQAYLLVLNIDARGKVDILLPSPREPQPVAARKITEILRVRAAAPAGSDTVRAFAFSAQPAGWNAFACKQVKQELTCPELLPGSPEFGRLLTMLRSASGANQSATLRLETVE